MLGYEVGSSPLLLRDQVIALVDVASPPLEDVDTVAALVAGFATAE
jgi:hypothetical protein